jgi:pyruvate/2-oxoacid:ferredoxin oxidoreductase beta subunit
LPVKKDVAAPNTVKGSQFLRPYLEFHGACAGCGETPYMKLATQLFGDRMIIANASGCSSVWGGTATTSPWVSIKNNKNLY